jgi:uncharacterized paraquat-inducible protein A
MPNDLITVATFRSLPEAEAVRMYLEAEGIAGFLADAETVNMDWLLGNALGYIKLQVASSEAEKAASLVNQMRARQRERRSADSDDDAEDACLACGAAMSERQAKCPACGWSYVGPEEN